jgi:uncharacterized protein (DUF2236 family)
VTADDLDRLRAATGRRRIDPSRSLFGPRSITWRVNREGLLLLGGGRALLLQVAHPLIAAGVAAHSRFRAEPLARLWRTLDLMLTIVFADAADALAAVRAIERVHARVRGVLDAPVGPFPRGAPYDASDPELLLWVHATLVDTALLVYERFVAPLAPRARAAYHAESKVVARLLGIPPDLVPRTPGEFQDYLAGMIASDVLTVGAVGRDVADSVLRPPVSVVLRPAIPLANLLTAGLLPPVLRTRYGLSWSAGHEALLRAVAMATRTVLPFVPAWMRLMPHARRAAVPPRTPRRRTLAAAPA